MFRLYNLLIYLLFGNLLFAQSNNNNTTFFVNFEPQFEGQILLIDEEAEEKELTENTPTIELLKFYISKITLQQNGQRVWVEEESYHLVNVAESNSLQLALDLPKELNFDAIQFQLGIDSLTNVAGVMGSDLLRECGPIPHHPKIISIKKNALNFGKIRALFLHEPLLIKSVTVG